MRRCGSILFAAVMALVMAGCGSSGSSPAQGPVNSQSEASPTPELSGGSGAGTSRHRRRHRSRSGGSGYSSTLPGAAPAPNDLLMGKRTKTSGCRVHGGLPDSACTPGATIGGVTAQQICVLGYAHKARHVSSSTKRRAYREYGIASHSPGAYEVDHLVPLELGGSNSIANLWPEAASPQPGFHQKDQVETYLHDQVCSEKMSLQQAQQAIATNWLATYKRSIAH